NAEWTCSRCLMTARFMPGAARVGLPTGWADDDGALYCIACRRDRAAEAAMNLTPVGTSLGDRRRAGLLGRIEFEVERDPNRADTRIARACESSVAAVKRVRERMGAYPTSPS